MSEPSNPKDSVTPSSSGASPEGSPGVSSGEHPKPREHKFLRYLVIFFVILFVVIPALLGFIGFFSLPWIPKR